MKVALLVGALSMLSMSVQAEVWALPYAKVQNIVISGEDRLGGCAVKLDINPGDHAWGCYENQYISFSCTGKFNEKDIAKNMLETAQKAAELGKMVRIRLEDTQKHNGACVGKRIEIQY